MIKHKATDLGSPGKGWISTIMMILKLSSLYVTLENAPITPHSPIFLTKNREYSFCYVITLLKTNAY